MKPPCEEEPKYEEFQSRASGRMEQGITHAHFNNNGIELGLPRLQRSAALHGALMLVCAP